MANCHILLLNLLKKRKPILSQLPLSNVLFFLSKTFVKLKDSFIMPITPTLWEVEAGGSLEVRSLRPAWQTWQNPVYEKYKILAGHGGMHL